MTYTDQYKEFLNEFFKEKPDMSILKKLLDENNIDVNLYRSEYGDTLLNIAAEDRRDYDLTKLLLEHGADPEIPLDDENCTVLWNMQYVWEDKKFDESLRITNTLLRYGADPASVCDNETLYWYVHYKVFNEYGSPDYDYIVSFFTLLIVYGAEKLQRCVDYKKPFNKDIALAYRFCFKDVGDGYHKTGVIYGPSEDVYAEL